MRGAGRPKDFHQLLLGSRFFLIRSASRELLAFKPASPRATENVVTAVGGGIEPAAVASRVGPYEDEPAVVRPAAVREDREVRGGAAVVSREGAPEDSLNICWLPAVGGGAAMAVGGGRIDRIMICACCVLRRQEPAALCRYFLFKELR
jgi:hypothetical protein